MNGWFIKTATTGDKPKYSLSKANDPRSKMNPETPIMIYFRNSFLIDQICCIVVLIAKA